MKRKAEKLRRYSNAQKRKKFAANLSYNVGEKEDNEPYVPDVNVVVEAESEPNLEVDIDEHPAVPDIDDPLMQAHQEIDFLRREKEALLTKISCLEQQVRKPSSPFTSQSCIKRKRY